MTNNGRSLARHRWSVDKQQLALCSESQVICRWPTDKQQVALCKELEESRSAISLEDEALEAEYVRWFYVKKEFRF